MSGKKLGANDRTTSRAPGAVFCPWCEHDFEADEPVTDAGSVPGEGDAGICWNCRKWWQVAKGGARVRYAPTAEEIAHVNAYLRGIE